MNLYKTLEQQKTKEAIQKKELPTKLSVSNVTGISNNMKSQFEKSSGFSFDDVRVHYNSYKPSMFQALAYTQGNNGIPINDDLSLEKEADRQMPVVQRK